MRKTAPYFRHVSPSSPGAGTAIVPLFPNIRGLLHALPPADTAGATLKYKLMQADGALNFVYTSLTRATAFDYQNPATATTGYGPSANQAAAVATTERITDPGVTLSETFLARIRANGEGVILVEARQLSGEPLRLVVENAGVQIPEVELPLLGARFEPRPGMVQKGWDAYLEKGTPWTSVVAGEQGQVVRFHVATNAAAASIGFEVAPAGPAYLRNVDAQGRLLTSPGGAVFTLSGTYTDIPIYAAPQTGLGRYEAEIIAKNKVPSTGLLTSEVARLKVSILAPRQLRIHLFKVVDSNSPATEFQQMPTVASLITTLNGIYAQAGVRFIAGNQQTLDSSALGYNYDVNQNGSLDYDSSSQPLTDELSPLRNTLRNDVEGGLRYTLSERRHDFFAFVFKESRLLTTGITPNNQTQYYQRGGNLGRPDGESYGPIVASEGINDAEGIAAAIGHEIGHSLNLPFGNNRESTPLSPIVTASRFGVIGDELIPDLDDDHTNTTLGHDNFTFLSNSDSEALQIWSLMRSGAYRGDVTQLTSDSRSLRKLFWEELNFRSEQRLITP